VLVEPENTSSMNISIEEGNINLYNIIFLFINRNILFLGVNENQMALLQPKQLFSENKSKVILKKINIQRTSQLTPRKAFYITL